MSRLAFGSSAFVLGLAILSGCDSMGGIVPAAPGGASTVPVATATPVPTPTPVPSVAPARKSATPTPTPTPSAVPTERH